MEPIFYEDIHNYWSELQGVEITKVDTILNQVIWNTQFITIKNAIYMGKILSDNSNFLSHQEINDKYNVGCNFLNILQLRQSIPFTWREAIHGTDVNSIYINRNNITLN